jgi:hypothetical protein
MSKTRGLFEEPNVYVTIWFDVGLTPDEEDIITTLNIDISIIDSDVVDKIAQTAAVALGITRKARWIFAVRLSPDFKNHFFGPGTNLDPNKMSDVPGAWVDILIDWNRQVK